jgi:hypothetical protein
VGKGAREIGEKICFAMKFVQSLWIPPERRSSEHWSGRDQDLDYWTLSNKLLNKHGEVEFWGCPQGVIFAEQAGLRFSSMHEFPKVFSRLGSKAWSLPKLYAASQQAEPFLHVDGDVFLYEWKLAELPQFLVQSGEPFHADKGRAWFYGFMATLFRAGVQGVDRFWGRNIEIWNFGIFGGSCIQLPKVCREIFDFSVRNWSEIERVPSDVFTACVLEQILVPMLLADIGVQPTEYLRSARVQEDARAKGFCHLIGGSKGLPWVKARVKQRLSEC